MHPTPRDSAAYTLPPLRMTLSLHRRPPVVMGHLLHQPASSPPPPPKAEKRLKAETPLYKSIKAVSCRRTPTLFSDLGLEKKTVTEEKEAPPTPCPATTCSPASQLQELEVQALMFNCFSWVCPFHRISSCPSEEAPGRETRRDSSLAILLVSPLPLFLVFVGSLMCPVCGSGLGLLQAGFEGEGTGSRTGAVQEDGREEMEVFKRSLPWFQVLCKASPQRKEPSEEDYGASSASSSSGNQRLRRA
ncbi:hypothetical protein HPP92_009468 [Vanilla planifolia]|uniref:Uncharacterized protein n=1 Tax=Vanilla planifolia TaxID=51239 RepID=A0A835V7F8_VANPL|nr:hypothetical protein HPP92_009468 [Vanilla planifolia]